MNILSPLATSWESDLLRDLAPLIPDLAGRVVHLAMMREPYMSRVADGTKTIESRWGKVRCAPHNGISRREIIVFKRTGGPILGWTPIEWVRWWVNMDPAEVNAIVHRHRAGLGVEDDFAATVADARYATLIGLGPYHPIEAAHVQIGKTDRRGWVRLGRLP